MWKEISTNVSIIDRDHSSLRKCWTQCFLEQELRSGDDVHAHLNPRKMQQKSKVYFDTQNKGSLAKNLRFVADARNPNMMEVDSIDRIIL